MPLAAATASTDTARFPAELRRWRTRRGWSQLAGRSLSPAEALAVAPPG